LAVRKIPTQTQNFRQIKKVLLEKMKIVLMMALTADGKIAKHPNHLADWTSKEDKKLFSKISKEIGVVIMGEKTFKTLPKPLSERLNVVFTLEKNPNQIEGVRWVSGSPKKVIKELEKDGYRRALLAGGASLNSQFLKEKLISKLIITVEPIIFGSGLAMFEGDFNTPLKLKDLRKLNESTVALTYEILD